jgi:hypothetical protein
MEIEPYLKCGFGPRKFRISPKAKKYGRNIVFKDKKTSKHFWNFLIYYELKLFCSFTLKRLAYIYESLANPVPHSMNLNPEHWFNLYSVVILFSSV